MNLQDELKNDVSYRYSHKNVKEYPLEQETNKRGQRQGGIDKYGYKEKDKKGEL